MSTTPRHYTAQAQPVDALPGRFRTLQYQPTPSEHWYHVLFGHVPRFQMDFILRPELPCRKFRPQHFAHLGPQIKFLSPSAGLHYAVAIGNLSSNDTQHVAGRGGLSLLISTRVSDLRDHAQRESPVFAHSLIAIDEPLTVAAFSLTMASFVERVLDEGTRFYRGYYTSGQADNFERIYNYVRSFHNLRAPGDFLAASSGADLAEPEPYSSDGPPPYNQILIDCRGIDGRQVLHLAARLGVILYRTNLKWTSITTGSEEFESKIYQGEDYSIAIRLIVGGAGLEDVERQARGGAPGSRIMTCGFAELSISDIELGAHLFGLPGAPGAGFPAMVTHGSVSSFATQVHARGEALASDRGDADSGPMLPLSHTSLSNAQLADALASRPEFVPPLLSTAAPPPLDDRRPTGRVVPALLGGLVGLMMGAAGAGLLLRPPAGLHLRPQPSRNESTPKALGESEVRDIGSVSSGETRVPSGPRVSNAALRDDSDLALRRLLAESLSNQAKPMVTYAGTTQKRAKSVLTTHDSGPWRRLQTESEQLQNQLQKMNHVAAALSEPGSVHSIGALFESYCQALSQYKTVQLLESSHRLDRVPNP